jgi:hypothetical protein
VKNILYFNRQEGEEGLVKLLLEKCAVEGQKPIIIPTSDFSALAIDDEEIKKHFAVPYIINQNSQFPILNSQFSIGYWMDKSHQKALALSVGLNTAGSVVLERGENGFQIPESIKYPCFTKPVSSIGAGKKCQRRCNYFKELKAVLAIAGKNAEAMKATVSFECQDIFKASCPQEPYWDIIISNPPYICRKEAALMESNVLDHEPHEALFVPDEEPLLFYEAIGNYAQQGLKQNGLLAFEINPLYANQLSNTLSDQGFHDISIVNDSFGKQRFILCYR